jgi:hypothetical protein
VSAALPLEQALQYADRGCDIQTARLNRHLKRSGNTHYAVKGIRWGVDGFGIPFKCDCACTRVSLYVAPCRDATSWPDGCRGLRQRCSPVPYDMFRANLGTRPEMQIDQSANRSRRVGGRQVETGQRQACPRAVERQNCLFSSAGEATGDYNVPAAYVLGSVKFRHDDSR